MVCKKCSAENEEWSEYCYACRARLKPVELSKMTVVSGVIAILFAAALLILTLNAGGRKFMSIPLFNKVIFVVIELFTLTVVIGMLLFLRMKKKFGLYLSAAAWLIVLGFNVVMGGSPIFLAVVMIPVIATALSIIPIWKDLG